MQTKSSRTWARQHRTHRMERRLRHCQPLNLEHGEPGVLRSTPVGLAQRTGGVQRQTQSLRPNTYQTPPLQSGEGDGVVRLEEAQGVDQDDRTVDRPM